MVLMKICWEGTLVPVRIRPWTPNFTLVKKTKKVDESKWWGLRPDSGGIFLYLAPLEDKSENMTSRMVLVEDTPASGRHCRELKQGGSAMVPGFSNWKGFWKKLTWIEACRYVKEKLWAEFGIDKYGYGINATGVVVLHHNQIHTKRFPASLCGILITHQYVGEIKAL